MKLPMIEIRDPNFKIPKDTRFQTFPVRSVNYVHYVKSMLEKKYENCKGRMIQYGCKQPLYIIIKVSYQILRISKSGSARLKALARKYFLFLFEQEYGQNRLLHVHYKVLHVFHYIFSRVNFKMLFWQQSFPKQEHLMKTN